MIELKSGDITRMSGYDAIVSASNGKGICGAGVAGAIASNAGDDFKKEARQVCKNNKYLAGDCFITGPHLLTRRGIKNVYHAVTMDVPGGDTSLNIIATAMRKTLHLAVQNKIKQIAFPGLGTGIGQLNRDMVAQKMVQVAQEFCDLLDITIVDIDALFINCALKYINVEQLKKISE